MLIVLAISAVLYVATHPPTTTCFTPEDYAVINGDANIVEPFDPTTDFYGSSVAFLPGSSNYATDEAQNAKDESSRIASFYTRYTHKPMVIHLGTLMPADGNSSLAQARLDVVRKLLVQDGVAESDITTSIADYEAPTDGGRLDGIDFVTITLLSRATCK